MKSLNTIVIVFVIVFYSVAHSQMTDDQLYKAAKTINEFSKKTLTYPKNFNETKEIILLLLKVDKSDPSRDMVRTLSVSYYKHKKIYTKAFLELEKASKSQQEKKSLFEIQMVMDAGNANEF